MTSPTRLCKIKDKSLSKQLSLFFFKTSHLMFDKETKDISTSEEARWNLHFAFTKMARETRTQVTLRTVLHNADKNEYLFCSWC